MINFERIAAVTAAYESAMGRMNVPLEVFYEAVSGWEVVPVRVDGKLVGAVLMNGPEIHACIKPEGFGKWLTKGVLRNTLCKVLKAHGKAVTRFTEGNAAGEYFVTRLGFKKEGEAWVLRQQ